MPAGLKIALGCVVLLVLGLGYAARRFRYVAWLQRFDLRKNLSEQQQARVRRTANSTAGMQLILLGVMIAITFLGLKVMFFTTPTRFELVVMTAISGLCLALGIVAIYRNR